jgi:CRISPR-associated endonuclease/helicase Cas3
MVFQAFFESGTSGRQPYPFQVALARHAWPETLVVPTGFGKTAAVLAAWLWKVSEKDAETPRRLVYCLPMRTLVEQTEDAAKSWIETARTTLDLEVQLGVLMGGRSAERRGLPRWILNPHHPTIIIGTQDLLVSAALMRGYGSSRYRWPVDFALLHNDALWVFDEVQLTGAALATSAQFQAFRQMLGTARKCRTLWMSATLDPAWLKTVDFTPRDVARPHDLSADDIDGAGHLWTAHKTLKSLDLPTRDVVNKAGLKSYALALAKEALAHAKPATNTILFLNTVARAQAVFDALRNIANSPEQLLIHSRFRAADRRARMDRLRAQTPPEGRIIVTTQALEAGVDTTSVVMMTEIAPWSSLVQRFGRCNRYGERGAAGADVYWIDLPSDVDAARPYEPDSLANARKILATLSACGPADLARVPPSPPARGQVIRKRDLLELFDTEPDLSGFDVDISLYVREADDTDVRLFWRKVEGSVPLGDAPAPSRDELCPAPIGGAKELVKRAGGRAWRWDALLSEWRRARDSEVFPGMLIWIDSTAGGYDPEKGFDHQSRASVDPIAASNDPNINYDADPGSFVSKVRVGLAQHSAHVRDQAAMLADALGLTDSERTLLVDAALWHDHGKAHPAFVLRMGSITPPLAKSPNFTPRPAGDTSETRPCFRHELASALAYLANRDWSTEASLPAYLIAAHHGKVRTRLRALSKEVKPENGRLFARGVWDGDVLPETQLGGIVVPETRLDLELMQLGDGRNGPSWSARAQALVKELGPFRLAWLEALVRIADWRASEAEEEAGHDDV